QAGGEAGEVGLRHGDGGGGERTEGVEHVVVPGDRQLHGQLAVGRVDLDLGAAGAAALLPQRPRGVLAAAIAHDGRTPRGGALPEGAGARVVGAHHERAAGCDLRGEGVEGRGEVFDVAVEVEVVRLEVGDH